MHNSKLTTLILIVICTMLAFIIFYLMKGPQEITDVNSTGAIEELKLIKTPLIQAENLADISEFEEIIQRPLFSNSRMPEEGQIEEIVKQKTNIKPAQKTVLSLAGIVLSDEEEIALIKSRKEVRLQRIRLGEDIDGWKLIEIQANSVKLKSGSRQLTLELIRKTSPVNIQNKTLLNSPANKQANPNQKTPQPTMPHSNRIKGTPTDRPNLDLESPPPIPNKPSELR